jgi:hypothetical protein
MSPHRNIRDQLLARYKYFISFFKRDYAFEDYPVHIRRFNSEEVAKGLPRYRAWFINWGGPIGSGKTAKEARVDLRKVFASIKNHREDLPRPGTDVPIQLAPHDRVDAHKELANSFIQNVLELEWALITDQSALWDFHSRTDNVALTSKIKELYEVDVSDIESGNLADIFDRIATGKRL